MPQHIIGLISSLLDEKKVNASVLTLDGCGTCIIDSADTLEKVKEHISFADKAADAPGIADIIGEDRILDMRSSRVDPFDGVGKAFAMHHNKVAVLVTKGESAQEIRDCFGRNVLIIARPADDIDDRSLDMLFSFSDVIDVCASSKASDLAKDRGSDIPLSAVSETGREML